MKRCVMMLAAGLVLAGCVPPTPAPGSTEPPGAPGAAAVETLAGGAIQVTATEYKYAPAQLTVKAGQPATIQVLNNGTRKHSFEIEFPEDAGGEMKLEADVVAGETGTLTFTPTKPGSRSRTRPASSA